MKFYIHYSVSSYSLAKKGSRAEGSICRAELARSSEYTEIVKINDIPEKNVYFCYKLVPVGKLENFIASWSATATVTEDRLFGPATLKTGVIVYPCNKSGCWIYCTCKWCRCKYLQNFKDDGNSDSKDHKLYHKAWHLECHFCNEIHGIFPMYRYLIWDQRLNDFVNLGVLKHRYILAERKSKQEKLECSLCHLKFTKVGSQVRHYESVHTKEVYRCDQCNAVFNREDLLNTHVDDVHEYITKCEDCNTSFKSIKNFQRHVKDRLEKKNPKFVCHKCSAIFCTQNLLKRHQRKHKFTCYACNEIFTSDFNLTRHKGKKTIKCEQCDRNFCTNKQMVAHKKFEHENLVECENCGQKFSCSFTRKRHMMRKHCK